VAFGQHCHARDTAVGREVMQMDMQQGCACHFHAPIQRLFYVLEIVKPLSAEQVYDQMRTSTSNAVTLDKVVFPVVVRNKRALTMIFLLGGA
jgi:hypothetical protein